MATQNQDKLRTHFSSLAPTPTAQNTGWDSLWQASTFLPWDRGVPNPALLDLLSSSFASPPTAPPTSSVPNPTPGAPSTPPSAAIELPRPIDEAGKRRKVLVPGCGKGYDVALFSAYGFDAWGLEVSKSAVVAAEKYLEGAAGAAGAAEYEGKDGGKGKGRGECVLGDFFEDAWVEKAGGGGGFDVIYDNTVCFFFFHF